MKRFFSPLVWLCAAAALLLNCFAAFDPGGIYQAYLSQLDADTPPLAAVFTALHDGVYPWSAAPEPEPEPVPDPPAPEPEPEPEPEPPVEVSPYVTVDEQYFDDALFIGDSNTEGFADYAGLANATYYFQDGLTVWTVLEKPFIRSGRDRLTLEQALSTQRFGKIYLMLGINELGSGTAETFAGQYALVLNKLRELEPDAVIYVQGIFHTTQEKSDSSYFTNDAINERNAAIAALCDEESVFYLDCGAVFDDETGALDAELSGDGVHIKAPYYVQWKQFLFAHAVSSKK